MQKSAIVLGAGMVGVCSALELQRRGHDVTLIDRKEPGEETSFGNAGVLARGSFLPMNNPGLIKALPKLARNQGAGLRYDMGYVMRNLAWVSGFLANARRSQTLLAAEALNGLLDTSIALHKQLLAESGADGRLRETGWLRLFRSEASYDKSTLERELLEKHGVNHDILDPGALSDLEPHLKSVFHKAIWVRDTASVDNPGEVVKAYARLFQKHGGTVRTGDVSAVQTGTVTLVDGETLKADNIIIAMGPWSKEFLSRLGYTARMAYERGYHQHYRPVGNAALGRPICDVDGAYVMSAMTGGLRITCGVQLADQTAPPNPVQLGLAENNAREAFPLGEATSDTPWMGSRPTFPDSVPVIGPAPRHLGVWMAFGHQHIGFSTGPGTAALLANLIDGGTPPFPAHPFRPERYVF